MAGLGRDRSKARDLPCCATADRRAGCPSARRATLLVLSHQHRKLSPHGQSDDPSTHIIQDHALAAKLHSLCWSGNHHPPLRIYEHAILKEDPLAWTPLRKRSGERLPAANARHFFLAFVSVCPSCCSPLAADIPAHGLSLASLASILITHHCRPEPSILVGLLNPSSTYQSSVERATALNGSPKPAESGTTDKRQKATAPARGRQHASRGYKTPRPGAAFAPWRAACIPFSGNGMRVSSLFFFCFPFPIPPRNKLSLHPNVQHFEHACH